MTHSNEKTQAYIPQSVHSFRYFLSQTHTSNLTKIQWICICISIVFGVWIWERKYTNECTPFGYICMCQGRLHLEGLCCRHKMIIDSWKWNEKCRSVVMKGHYINEKIYVKEKKSDKLCKGGFSRYSCYPSKCNSPSACKTLFRANITLL